MILSHIFHWFVLTMLLGLVVKILINCLQEQADAPAAFRSPGFLSISFLEKNCLQEEPDEHGQGKWEGKQEGRSDKRITESKAQQNESTTLCINLAD
jgi:hypothetical protein